MPHNEFMLKTVLNSENAKVGLMSATYRSVGETCSDLCALLHTNTCYALFGNVALHQRKSSHDVFDGMRHYNFVKDLPAGRLLRLHVSGDFFYQNEVDRDYLKAVVQSGHDFPEVKQYTYTHDIVKFDQALKDEGLTLPKSLTVNASCDTWEQVKAYQELGYPTVITLPHTESRKSFKQDGMQVTVCPSQLQDITCAQCGLCMLQNRKTTIGFLAHGTRKFALTEELKGREA